MRMAFVELEPPPPYFSSHYGVMSETIRVEWAGRWPDPRSLSTGFQKVSPGGQDEEALPIYAFLDPAKKDSADAWARHLGFERAEDLLIDSLYSGRRSQ